MYQLKHCDLMQKIKLFYEAPNASIGPCADIHFMDSPIKVNSGKMTAREWEVIIDQQNTEV